MMILVFIDFTISLAFILKIITHHKTKQYCSISKSIFFPLFRNNRKSLLLLIAKNETNSLSENKKKKVLPKQLQSQIQRWHLINCFVKSCWKCGWFDTDINQIITIELLYRAFKSTLKMFVYCIYLAIRNDSNCI